MASNCNIDGARVSQFKQEVFTRLTFLGMPHGDAATLRHVWKFVNLLVKLLTDQDSSPSTTEKLVRALTREFGAPRAQLFIRWLTDKSRSDFGKELTLPIPQCDDKAPSMISKAVNSTSSIEGPKQHSAALGLDMPSYNSLVESNVASASLCTAAGPTVKAAEPACNSSVDSMPLLECDNEAWVEVKVGSGKVYYWDRRTNACIWALPKDVKPMWVSHKAADGRTYYADRNGKSFWVMPPLKNVVANNIATSAEVSAPTPCLSNADLLQLKTTETQSVGARTDPVPVEDAPVQLQQPGTPGDQASGDNPPSSDVLSLREELELLRKKLADLNDKESALQSPTRPMSPARSPSAMPEANSPTQAMSPARASSASPAADSPAQPMSPASAFAASPVEASPAELVSPARASSASPVAASPARSMSSAKSRSASPEADIPLRRRRCLVESANVEGEGWEVWLKEAGNSRKAKPARGSRTSRLETDSKSESAEHEETTMPEAKSDFFASVPMSDVDAESDLESQCSVETRLTNDEDADSQRSDDDLDMAQDGQHAEDPALSADSGGPRTLDDGDAANAALRSWVRGICGGDTDEASRLARSRSPHGERKRPKIVAAGGGNGGSPMLDKFMEDARLGKPPGKWEESPSQIWGKGSAFARRKNRSRRASIGGA